jgi:class 3 adenylate cyclase
VEQRHDLFGSTVQLAARLCAFAQPDQVVVSGETYDLCQDAGLRFHDASHAQLKGFDQPVRVHTVVYG